MAHKQAHYHQHGKAPLVLDIVKEHKDGKVDLAQGEEVVVTSCILANDSTPGTCTLVKPAAKARHGAKHPTTEEKAKALEDARAALKVAEEAFAKEPTDTDLGKRVDELREAVEELEN